MLPTAGRRNPTMPAGMRRGKMILSCRSHYFRDLLSQNAMLVGEDREGLDAEIVSRAVPLAVHGGQIRGYLGSCLGSAEKARAALEVIARVHDLRELAERPYLLSLIARHLEQLEIMSLSSEPVNAARLYDLFIAILA